MPRIFRILPEEGVFHILTRGNNRQKIFKDDTDYERYLYLLELYKQEHQFLLYHYCLMSNHLHLIIETTQKTNLSRFMKQINLAYLYHYRKRYSYYGHFWQGRYKSLLIDKDEYLIACGRYIELNPVRAKIVKGPKDYKWSSYNVYAYGKEDRLVDYDPIYVDTSCTDEERRENYRRPMQEELLEVDLNMRFLGKEEFITSMEERFGVKNIRNKRDRPRK